MEKRGEQQMKFEDTCIDGIDGFLISKTSLFKT